MHRRLLAQVIISHTACAPRCEPLPGTPLGTLTCWAIFASPPRGPLARACRCRVNPLSCRFFGRLLSTTSAGTMTQEDISSPSSVSHSAPSKGEKSHDHPHDQRLVTANACARRLPRGGRLRDSWPGGAVACDEGAPAGLGPSPPLRVALPHVDGWHYRDSIARAASGHAVAAPPSSVMKSRRFTRSPRRRAAGETKASRDQVPWLSLA